MSYDTLKIPWLKPEIDHLRKCFTNTTSFSDGMLEFNKKYPNRNVGMVSNALNRNGIKVTISPNYRKEKNIENDLRAQITELQRDLVQKDALLKQNEHTTREAEKILNVIHAGKKVNFSSVPVWNHTKSGQSVTGTAIHLLSDLHATEVVEKAEMRGDNEYNTDIFRARMKHTADMTLKLLFNFLSKPKYDGMILGLGGDIYSGFIHEELDSTNDMEPPDAVRECTYQLVKYIKTMRQCFDRMFIPCVVGNHGRQDKKPRFKRFVRRNWEWLIYHLVADQFKDDPGVQFAIPEAPDITFNVYGRDYWFTHGTQFKGGNAISGIMTALRMGQFKKLLVESSLNRPFHTMLVGHFHQEFMTERLVVNGSMIGYNEFAKGLNFPFEEPTQSLWIDHPDKQMAYSMPVQCNGYEKKNKQKSIQVAWR